MKMFPGHKTTKEAFVEEKIGCFKERWENFISEMETDASKRLCGLKQTRERLLIKIGVVEAAEEMAKKEKGKLKEALVALVGFDVEGTGELPVYKERKVEIDDSPTAYTCTDESIPLSL